MIIIVPCEHGFKYPRMCPHGCHTAPGCACEPEYIEKRHGHTSACPLQRTPPEIIHRLEAVKDHPNDRVLVGRLYAAILRFGERSEAERLAVSIANAMVGDELSDGSFRSLPRSIKDKLLAYSNAVNFPGDERGEK